MELVDKLFEIPVFISRYIISYIYLPVLLLIILKISVNANSIAVPLNFIKWIIISYCIITILCWLLILMLPHSGNYAFIKRATGPYAWAYWLMLFFNCLLPLVLLHKKFGKNVYIVFVISFLMNFGALFEKFVIIITSFHRDYLP